MSEQPRGDRKLGKYRVTRKLGQGAYGIVVEAIDTSLGIKVALKILDPGLTRSDPSFVQKYVNREARILARLQHPNIVHVLGDGQDAGVVYLVLEYIDGQTFDTWVKNTKPSLAELLRVIEQIAGALDCAHAKGIIHRDIKPSNILIDKSGNAHLSDFGLAHAAMTTIGSISSRLAIGTATYMSPEQAEGRECHARSDVYSLGVVVYEALAGQAPFKAETVLGYIRAHADKMPPPPAKFNRGISQDVQDVILKALNKSPDDRFSSAGTFSRALSEAAQRPYRKAETVVVPPIVAKPPVPPPAGNRPVQPRKATLPKRKRGMKNTLWWVGGIGMLGMICVAIALLGTRWMGLGPSGNEPAIPSTSTPDVVAESTLSEGPDLDTTPTLAPSATPTQIPAEPPPASTTPTETPTVEPTETSTPKPTATATPEPTATSTPRPTATPTVVPQPAPIPLSSLQVLFQDDFSDPNRGWTQYLNRNRGNRIKYQENRLQISTSSEDVFSYNIAYPGLRFQDFVLEVDVQNLTDVPSTRMGVVFRAEYDSSTYHDYGKYYFFTVGDDGICELRIRHGWELLTPPIVSEAVDRFGGVNQVHVEAVDGRFRFFVNDQFVMEFEHIDYEDSNDHDYSLGDIGLFVVDPNEVGVRVGFDNLVVGLLPE